MKKYFYCRGEGTLANDDGKGDSVLIPIENITGFQASADTTIDVHYHPQEFANKYAENVIVVSDKDSLTITTAKRKVVTDDRGEVGPTPAPQILCICSARVLFLWFQLGTTQHRARLESGICSQGISAIAIN